MPGQNKHIYTSEDIQRYHSGAMSQAEMHAMEKAALEDPFLADAMEGYVHSRDMNAELQSLHNSLQEKTDTKVVAMPASRRSNFGWMRIAALFIVFAAAGWVIFRMNTTEEKGLSLEKATERQLNEAKQADVVTGKAPATDTTTEETYVPVIKEQPLTAAAPVKIRNSQLQNKSISRSLPPVINSEAGIYDSLSVATVSPVIATETIAAQKAIRNDFYDLSAPRMNTINGVVTDERNNAIPFASVIARNVSGTLTDNNGRFQLKVPDTMSVVGVNAPGYVSRSIAVNEAKDQSQIVLKESADETEEVVLARSRSANQAKANQEVKQTIVEIGELEPEGGWSEYNSYIAEKLSAPKNKKKTVPTGIVELSFDVDEKGNPVNITVEKSLCISCDKEAIRLLKEGPRWKKQEGKGKITIRF